MADFDITRRHHGDDPHSSAAHAKTDKVNGCERVCALIEARPRGATFADAMAALGMVRQSASSRCSELQNDHRAFAVELLHRFDLFLDIEESRPVPGSIRGSVAQVLIGRQRLLEAYGPMHLPALAAAQVKVSKARGKNPPIETMSARCREVYDYVNSCGERGSTCDGAQHELGLDQGNGSNRFRDLRGIKALIPVKELHKLGKLLATRASRQTRQRSGAAVLVSFETALFIGGLTSDELVQLMTVEEMNRLARLLL